MQITNRRKLTLFIIIRSQYVKEKVLIDFLHSFRNFSLFSQRKQAIFGIKIPIFAIFDPLRANNASWRVVNHCIDQCEHRRTRIHNFHGIFGADKHFFSKNRDIFGRNWPFQGGRFMKRISFSTVMMIEHVKTTSNPL